MDCGYGLVVEIMSTDQRSHVCGICSKSFMRLAALGNHERLSHPANEDIIKASCQERAPNRKGNSKKVNRRIEGKGSPASCSSQVEKVISNDGKHQQFLIINGSHSDKTKESSKLNDRCLVDSQNNSRRFTECSTEVSDKSHASLKDKNNNRVLKLHSVIERDGSYHCSNCRMKVDKVVDLMSHTCRGSCMSDASTKITCRDCGRSSADCLCGVKIYHIAIEEKSVSCTKCGKVFPDDRIRCKHESYHCQPGAESGAAAQVSRANGKACLNDIKTPGNTYKEAVVDEKRVTYVKCSHCEKAFQDDLSLNNHILSHKELSQFDCFFCRLVFSSGDSLKSHLKAEHGHLMNGNRTKENDIILTDSGTWYGCSMCPKLFSCKSNRRRHERWHFGIRPHSCEQCGAAFRQRWQLLAHQKSKRCKENRMRSRIIQTEEKHKSGQPAEQDTYQMKELVHPIQLQSSDKGVFGLGETVADESSRKSGLHMHTASGLCKAQTSPTPASQASVLGIPSVPTSLSTEASYSNDSMCLDQRSKDTNVLPESAPLDLTKIQVVTPKRDGHPSFVCQDCGQVCKTKRNLVIHKRIHTGERPYTCSMCHLTFRQSHHRKAHMLSKHGVNHSTAKPITKQEIIVVTEEGIRYQCHYCSKVLMSRSGRRKHERWHLGLRPHRCNVCGNTFKQLQHLKKHQMSSKCRTMRLLQTPPKKFVGNNHHVGQNSNPAVASLTSLHMIQMLSKVGHQQRVLDADVPTATSPRDAPEMMDMPRALGLISTKELEAKKRAKEELAKKIAENIGKENGNYIWKADDMQIPQQLAIQENLNQSAGEGSEEESSRGKLVIVTPEADVFRDVDYIKEEAVSEVEEGEVFEMMGRINDSEQYETDQISVEPNIQEKENEQTDDISPLNLSNSNGGKDASNSSNSDTVDRSTNQVQCHICGQYYKSRQNLAIHMRMHTGERPYNCSVCNKKFIQPHHLKAHLKSKHDIIMVTPTKPLREDEVVDTPEGLRFKCQYCPKLLTSKNGRQKHERWHLGLRPHKCDVCGKAFKQSHHLKRHKIGTACIPPEAVDDSTLQRCQGANVFTVSQTLSPANSPVTLLVPAAMLGSRPILPKNARTGMPMVSSMTSLLVPSLANRPNVIQVVQTNHAAPTPASDEMVPEDLSMSSAKM